jgi:hypothetical protein
MDIDFDTHPDRYVHWRLTVDGEVATLAMDVQPRRGLRDDYELKLNSYDLGVDIELADAVQRLRFEHPEVRCVVVRSAHDRAFCAGANIPICCCPYPAVADTSMHAPIATAIGLRCNEPVADFLNLLVHLLDIVIVDPD